MSSHGHDDGAFSCAVLVNGRVYCWGYGALGTMGNGTTTTTNVTPQLVSGLDDAVQVSVGEDHACAVRRTGAIACWGDNAFGQLGDGTTNDASSPVSVQGIADGVEVSAGGKHTCAVDRTGDVSCWEAGRMVGSASGRPSRATS